jgi:hypothetical protein
MMLPELVNNKELIMKKFIIIASMFSLMACGGGESADTSIVVSTPITPPTTTQSTSTNNLTGLWQHSKLATILNISQTSYTLYQTAGDYCLQVNQQDINKLSDDLGEYKLSTDKQRIDVDLEDDFESMFYQPLEQLPLSCTQAIMPDSEAVPSLVFETFWHHFNDSYASFDRRNVDWKKIYGEYAAHVSDNMSSNELQNLITKMLQKFGDAHAGIIVDKNTILRSINYSPLQQQLAEELNINIDNSGSIITVDDKLSEAGATIVQKYLSDVELLATDQVIWGKLANGFGYLNLRSMNFNGDSDTDNLSTASEINKALSSRLTTVDHLVIDLRFNLGGNVPAALKIANFIANQSGHAFDISYKQAGEISVPSSISTTSMNIGFTGNVFILTSRHTGSAAEAFIYAVKVGNQAQLIGENTRGILAGPTPKTLANGWIAMVPNRVISGPSGEVLESVGFTPDTMLPAFTLADMNQRIDGVLELLLTF